MKLTDRQSAFIREYLVDLNANQAAIRAGYSEKTARHSAARLLANVNIQAELNKLKAERNERVEVSADDVLRLLKEFAYSDITETMELTAEEIKALPLEIRRLIVGFKKVEGTFKDTLEIKFIDKLRALDMLSRHIGFYEKDNKQQQTEVKQIFKIGNQEIEF